MVSDSILTREEADRRQEALEIAIGRLLRRERETWTKRVAELEARIQALEEKERDALARRVAELEARLKQGASNGDALCL
jgi:hypothetical protein